MLRVLFLAALTVYSLASMNKDQAAPKHGDLVHAVKNGQYNAMLSLLAEGADKNFQDISTGSSLLALAAQENRVKIVKHLLEIGTNVHMRDFNGGTALFGSAINGFTECTELLIKAGIDVNAVDSKQFSAIHYASFRGRTQIVDILLDNKADHSGMNAMKMTPFMLACQDGSCGAGSEREWIMGYLGDRLNCDGMEGRKIDCSPKKKGHKSKVRKIDDNTVETEIVEEETTEDVDVIDLEKLQDEQDQAAGEVADSDEL
jgi:hypothetical protein